jgi:hypothetical protein
VINSPIQNILEKPCIKCNFVWWLTFNKFSANKGSLKNKKFYNVTLLEIYFKSFRANKHVHTRKQICQYVSRMNTWTLHQQSIVYTQVVNASEKAREEQILNTQMWQVTRILGLEWAITQSPQNYEIITSTIGITQLPSSCEPCNEFPVSESVWIWR